MNRSLTVAALLMAALAPIASAQSYTYDYNDSFPSSGFPNQTYWRTPYNGALTPGALAGGNGSGPASNVDPIGGSLISNFDQPHANDYEVKETLTITQGGTRTLS